MPILRNRSLKENWLNKTKIVVTGLAHTRKLYLTLSSSNCAEPFGPDILTSWSFVKSGVLLVNKTLVKCLLFNQVLFLEPSRFLLLSLKSLVKTYVKMVLLKLLKERLFQFLKNGTLHKEKFFLLVLSWFNQPLIILGLTLPYFIRKVLGQPLICSSHFVTFLWLLLVN